LSIEQTTDIAPGDSLDSENNLYVWRLAVVSVPSGDKCRAARNEALGAWRYASPTRRSGSSSAWR